MMVLQENRPRQQNVFNNNNQSQTQTITEDPKPLEHQQQQPQQLVLHLGRLPKPLDSSQSQPQPSGSLERRVTFTPDTIDNEHMGRLKSNCCCIYVPPRKWDDPSTWEPDEAETEHCRGHTLPPPPPPPQQPDKKPKDDDDEKDNGGHGPGCC